MRHRTWVSATCLALLASCQALVLETEPSQEGEEIWKEKPHHVSVLPAMTVEASESASAFTLGVDYEYRASDFLGVGAVAEQAFEEIDSTTLLAVVDLHITPQFVIQTGPGIEIFDDTEEFAYRIGVLYEWELEGRTLSPQVHYDLTSGEDAWVFALALGFCF